MTGAPLPAAVRENARNIIICCDGTSNEVVGKSVELVLSVQSQLVSN